MKTKITLLIILVLGAFLRLFQLSSLPIGLFGDEIDVGYQAWSLWTTGRDYMGNFLPSYIQSLAESRAPLLMYLTSPFVGLLGPSTFSVRLPVALLGVASVYLFFLVAKNLYKNDKVALLASFILSITPWHIHYSRAAFEVVPLVFLLLLGINLFLNSRILLSLIPFALTLFTYSTAVVYTPLIVLGLFLIFGKPKITFNTSNSFLLLLVFFLLALSLKNIFLGTARNRFQSLSMLNSFPVAEEVILSRNETWIENPKLEKLLVNKYTVSAQNILNNYLSAFSPSFLFTKGDPFFRHSSGKSGELLWGIIPLFILGLIWLVQNLKNKSVQFLLLSLLLAPIPSSLTTTGATHATRLFLMLPPLVLISALSVNLLQQSFLFKKLSLSLLGLLLLTSFSFYYYNFQAHYKYQSWQYWHFGFENIFQKLGEIDDNFNKVYINNTYQPSLLSFAFYTKEHPSIFQSRFTTDNQESFSDQGFTGFVYKNKYHFGGVGTLEQLNNLLTTDTLYLVVQGKEVPGDWNWQKEPPSWAKVHHTVLSPLGEPLFYLVSGTND